MAANNRGTIITTRGLQLVTKLTSSRVQMEFSSVKVGTGSPPSGTDPSELTQLVTYKMDGTIAEYGYDEEVKDAYVVMQLMNTGIESGFVMTEIGLYAIDPDLGEILYAYVDLSDDPNHILPAENGRSKTVQIKLHVIVGEVTEITATINPLSQITRAEFDKEIGKKLDSQGGDIADTVVSAFDISMDSFPVPKAGEKPRTLWGKMKKFTEDVKNWKTGVCLIGQIVNNCVTSRADLPLSAAQGKALMDQLTVLNTNFTWLSNRVPAGRSGRILSSMAAGSSYVYDVTFEPFENSYYTISISCNTPNYNYYISEQTASGFKISVHAIYDTSGGIFFWSAVQWP